MNAVFMSEHRERTGQFPCIPRQWKRLSGRGARPSGRGSDTGQTRVRHVTDPKRTGAARPPHGIIGRMALSSTIFVVDINLADADRNVYETLALRLARHPSESDEFLVARLLAYCLEHTEGIEFSRGLSDADEPAIAVRDHRQAQGLDRRRHAVAGQAASRR